MVRRWVMCLKSTPRVSWVGHPTSEATPKKPSLYGLVSAFSWHPVVVLHRG